MATVVRTVGVTMASSAVRCAMEPGRKALPQAVVPGRLSVSGAGELGHVRCQASTLTGVRELADGVVDMQRAALRGSFEAASVSGRAGVEECHPVLDEARFLSVGGVSLAAEACEQSRMYYGRRGGGDAYFGAARSSPAEDVRMERSSSTPHHEMVAAFEAALAGAGRNAEALCEMATRAWRKLGDADRAEQLYLEALQIAPEDSAVQASYAQFLWQCDA